MSEARSGLLDSLLRSIAFQGVSLKAVSLTVLVVLLLVVGARIRVRQRDDDLSRSFAPYYEGPAPKHV